MKNLIINKLRERTNIKGKQKTWISECTDDQLYSLYLRLRNGESARAIACFIQQDLRIREESDIHSISQGVLKFRNRIRDLLELKMEGYTPLGNEVASYPGTEHPDDDLLGLERLVRLQRERVERMMNEERESGLKHPSLSKDIHSLAALSKVLTKEKEFALNHPENDPIKKKDDDIIKHRIHLNFNSFMNNTTEESRQRMLQVMDKFLAEVAKHVISIPPEKEPNIGI